MRLLAAMFLILPFSCLAQTDFCLTLNHAMSAVGAGGGLVDMRSVTGTQTCLTDPFSGITAPITLLLGNVTINVEGTTDPLWRVPGKISILGTPSLAAVGSGGTPSGTVLNFQLPLPPPAPSPTQVTSAIGVVGGQVELGYFSAIGSSNVGTLINVRAQSQVRIHNLSLSAASFISASGRNAAIAAGSGGADVWITDNTITRIGVPGSVNQASSDIYVVESSMGNARYHIRNNQISGSSSNISITCFDCVDSDAIGNQIDENNSIRSDVATSGGYGILFYAVDIGAVQNLRIESNNITNTAGSGIYCVSCAHTSISNNVVTHVAQQQSDTSLPVGCISVNGFDHSSVVGNVCYGSQKDGYSIASAGYTPLIVGSVFSGNTAHNVAGTGFNFRSASTLKYFTVTGNTVDQIPGASGNAFSIYPGGSIQSAIFTGNNASGGTYNLTACTGCVIANNF